MKKKENKKDKQHIPLPAKSHSGNYRISNWKGLNRPPMVAQRGHFLLAPCSPIRTSTQAWHRPQMHSVQAYDSLSSEMPWQAAQ